MKQNHLDFFGNSFGCRRATVATSLLFFVAACDASSLSFGTSEHAAAPAGSDAAFVSETIPDSLFPGERVRVQVTMQNTGSALDGSNDWDSGYALYRRDSAWKWVYSRVDGTVSPGESTTFDFIIIAPTLEGSYDFEAQMWLLGDRPPFGAVAQAPNILVDNAVQPQWACAWDEASSIWSSTMQPGASQTAVFHLVNAGTQTWQTGAGRAICLRNTDEPFAFWGGASVCRYLTNPVASGESVDVEVPIQAPASTGDYTFSAQLFDFRPEGVGRFSSTPCVNTTITVAGELAQDAALISQDLPGSPPAAALAPGEQRVVNVTVRNDGTSPWTASGPIGLFSRTDPLNLLGFNHKLVEAQTEPGEQHTFSFRIRAPTTPGNYTYRFQMRDTSAPNGGYFGTIVDVPFVVDGAAQAEWASAVVAQDIPTRITAGAPATFSVTMRNTGSSAWSGSNFSLRSTNSPFNVWGRNTISLGVAETVAQTATRVFTFTVNAPAIPGTYASAWRMFQAPAIGLFGAEANTGSIEVTLCGNGSVDAGETCDDGNLVAGDGCSATCTPETRKITLDGDPVAKTFFGSANGAGLASVTIGDVNDDGDNEILVAEISDVTPSGGSTRTSAGQVAGYVSSVGGFLNSGSLVVPAQAGFTILGAEAGDHLGALEGNKILVGDVTGDGIGDVVVGATDADGLSNARPGSGEVYVVYGGNALLSAGEIDLADAPPAGDADPAIAVRIVGENVGDGLRVLALGDVTGDGTFDLILGAPNDDTAGSDAGAVWVVEGGLDLIAAGTVDLASPPGGLMVAKILGAAAGDQLGLVAAVGPLGGTNTPDLLVAAANHSTLTTGVGAAWALFGPIAPGATLAGADVTWVGEDENEGLGTSLAIGQVVGTADMDVVIGSPQHRQPDDLPYGAIDVWAGPFVTNTDFDLSTDTPDGRITASKYYDRLGQSLALGDYNDDGFMDIAGCASEGDGPDDAHPDSGEIRLVLGGPSLGAIYNLAEKPPRMSVYGARSGDFLGNEVSTIIMGDLDGDGLSDVCTGSPFGGSGASSQGRVDCILAE
ncbi:MAG: FG-GAP repeat protein [Deltaproteobacteria bacterium]|nr:FG-GAP repeat protein [Deltaproteobacteria bacterium]